jgi:hypothetical protein
MVLTTRFSSSGFLEIKVDEIEVVIFKNNTLELNQLIENLKSVIEDLEHLNEQK